MRQRRTMRRVYIHALVPVLRCFFGERIKLVPQEDFGGLGI